MLLKPKHTDNFKNIVCILLWFYRSFGSKGLINTLKKDIASAMECVDLAHFNFRYVTDKILFTLHVYFARSVSLVFFAVLDKGTDLTSSFIEAS